MAPVAAQQRGTTQSPLPVTATAGSGTVTFLNGSSNRLFIIGLGAAPSKPVRLTRETLEATVPKADGQQFLILEVTRRIIWDGVMNPCNPAGDCPVPPGPPPPPPPLPFMNLLMELKPKMP
jgi:hypothetical protein